MPTYVYRCAQCGNHLEAIQKFSDAPLKVCPKCQGQLKRVIHASGIVFKGSGWYVTDSRSSSSTATSKSSSKPADKAATTSESAPSDTASAPAASPAPSTSTSTE